jgi:signal transduction histidine kinase
MIVIRRRLFWKIYLTLLSSLVAVAFFMGCFWWFLGETQREWGEASRSHAVEATGLGAATLQQGTGQRTGGPANADVSVYASDGTLIASRGEPIKLGPDTRWMHHHILRVDLPDGHIVLTQTRPPPGGLLILAVMASVAGGIGLAAFPVTARLTRSLEALRAGAARWGEGDLSARVDETGSDEVALVARTFNAAASRLDAVLTSQRALLANASHELRSPLSRLRIAIELWLHNPLPEAHDGIVQDLADIDQLVEEILLSSRLDHAGPILTQTERIDVLGLAAEEAARFGVAVTGQPVDVQGNAVLLRRLCRNLLENAMRHGRPPVCLAVSRQGGEACIAVSDSGPGIAPEERERIFEPFYRPAGRSESAGGWGLGLSLVRQIAIRHGGRAICREESGGGSHFIVHLAAIEPADAAGDHRLPTDDKKKV